MTETPNQERTAAGAEPSSSLNTENLRDFSRLYRSSSDRKVAGVAGGLGRHLNIDPVILRVLFVVLCFFGGAGFILYGAAWLLVPVDNGKSAHLPTSDRTRNALLAITAIFAGLLLIGDSWAGLGFPWPLAVLALVLFVVLQSRDNSPALPPAGQPSGHPGGQFASQPGSQFAGQASGPEARSPYQRRGPILFGFMLGLVAVAWGALGLYDAGAGHLVADAAYPALALAIIGALLVVGSFVGRPGGLVLAGLVAAAALAATAVASPRYDGDRNQELAPAFASNVEDSYHVPAGRIELDLRHVRDLAELDGRTFNLSANAGELVVLLPPGLSAKISADVGIAGAIDLPDHNDEGLGARRDETLVAPDEQARITLNLDVTFGHIEVRQES